VVKVVNDACSGIKNSDTTKIENYKPMITNEKEAMSLLSSVLCPTNKKPLSISSIQVSDKNVKVKQNLNFTTYSKSEAVKYEQYQAEKPKKDTVVKPKTDSSLVSIQPKPVILTRPPADTQKINYTVKSTADLNAKTQPVVASIKNESFTIKSENEKSSTRLEVDNALFSLLKEDLKRKIKSTDEQLKEYSTSIKQSNGTEKTALTASAQETKTYKSKLQGQLKETDNKLRQITKLLRLEQTHKAKPQEATIFAKNKQSDFLDSDALPKGLVYKIQIGVYKNAISGDVFKGLTPVYGESFAGGVRYSVGIFERFYDAQQAKTYIKNMGLTDAFVVAYFNGDRITIELAKTYEKK
jgi:hypothetical protein